MKIAYFSADSGVPVAGHGGASVHIREMVNALSQAGHQVFLLARSIDDKKPTEEVHPEAKRHLINAERFHLRPANGHLRFQREVKDFESFLQTKSLMKEELRNKLNNLTFYGQALKYLEGHDVDLVYERYSLFSYAGIQLAKHFKVPHVLEMNAPLATEQEKMHGLAIKNLALKTEKRILQQTDQVLVVSKALRQHVVNCDVPASRIRVLPNAVDPRRFGAVKNQDRKTMRKKYGLVGKRVIGFVGALTPWQGPMSLLSAFARVNARYPQIHLMIVGDGPGRKELMAFIDKNGLNQSVTFTGNIDHHNIPRHIAAMDVTVAPYIPNDHFYHSPIKVFEYQAMAKPVVASAVGQLTDLIVNGETGILFEPGNIDQLAAALENLANDADLCQSLGRQARLLVLKDRTWEQNAKQVLAVANTLIKRYDSQLTDTVTVTVSN